MRIALISDIHANIVALEAVMEAIKKHHPEQICSLGDQVNLGPCPVETLELLASEGVTRLHGNHERYILSVKHGDPAYDGANFNALRFNAALLHKKTFALPKDIRIGCATLTHAMPGDDRFPVYNPAVAMPLIRRMNLPAGTHILCGHGHNPTSYAVDGVTIHSIGSVGCMDDGVPGVAPYTIAEIEEDAIALRPFYAQYDPRRLKPLFIKSGMAEFCPIMARIACMEMTNNKEYLVQYASMAGALSKEKGEKYISQETWNAIEQRFDPFEHLSTADFWKQA